MSHRPDLRRTLLLGLLVSLSMTPLANAASKQINNSTAANKWAEVTRWPDLQGGLWHADGADGAPHAFDLPLKPEVATLSKQLEARFWSGAEGGSCAPRGLPRHLGNQFIYSPGMIVMLGQADYYQVVRRIYMDGRKHEVIEPAYFGTSNGHWEGDTLVIETTGFLPEQPITDFVPGYGKTEIIERYRLLQAGKMQLQLTVINPEVLSKPYTETRVYTLQAGEETLESYCTNNRDQPDGRADLNLAP